MPERGRLGGRGRGAVVRTCDCLTLQEKPKSKKELHGLKAVGKDKRRGGHPSAESPHTQYSLCDNANICCQALIVG